MTCKATYLSSCRPYGILFPSLVAKSTMGTIWNSKSYTPILHLVSVHAFQIPLKTYMQPPTRIQPQFFVLNGQLLAPELARKLSNRFYFQFRIIITNYCEEPLQPSS